MNESPLAYAHGFLQRRINIGYAVTANRWLWSMGCLSNARAL